MIAFLAAVSITGCATSPLPTDGGIVGTWTTTAPNGACVSYDFRVDGSMTFDDGQTVHLGGYAVADGHLSLSFDGGPTITVPYAIGRNPGSPPAFPAFDTLTITNDPALVPEGVQHDVVYGRHPCTP